MAKPLKDLDELIRQGGLVESIRIGQAAADALVQHPDICDLLTGTLGHDEGTRTFRALGLGVSGWFSLPTFPLFIIDDALGRDATVDSGETIKDAAGRWLRVQR